MLLIHGTTQIAKRVCLVYCSAAKTIPPSRSFHATSVYMASEGLSNRVSQPLLHEAVYAQSVDWEKRDGFYLYKKDIKKNAADNRTYRLVVLSNGLRVALVHDEQADKAAACLSVGVGHLSDPDDLPGLAHFCEHMLFLGTEKYPDEAEYKRYLSEHSGASNASTSMDETKYHFSCHPSGLEGALARHAQFFTAPLFVESCTNRELNAVDSEFRRNLQLDNRRLFQLSKATSDTTGDNTFWKFGTGSKETLDKEGIRQRVMSWYAAHYSSNIMNLSIVSSHSLDELTALACKEYGSIPNSNLERPVFNSSYPLGPEQLQKVIYYRTIKNSPQLLFEFVFPDTESADLIYKKPGQILSHFVGHEGRGSILSYLKRQGWASALSAYSGGGAHGFQFFKVSINLTETGLQVYDKVISAVYDYLEILKKADASTVELSFSEATALGKTFWRWREKGNPATFITNLASKMHSKYLPSDLLVGGYYPVEFDFQAIQKCASYLSQVKSRVFVGSSEPLDEKHGWDLQEEYYSTEYCIRDFDELRLANGSQSNELHLPEPNRFIPSALVALTETPVETPLKRPRLIKQTKNARLFYKKDDTWCVPRASIDVVLRLAEFNSSPKDKMKLGLYTSLVRDILGEELYDAALSGLSYSFSTTEDGISWSVSGFSEKLDELLLILFRTTNDPEHLRNQDRQALETRFNSIYDRFTRSFSNSRRNNPSALVNKYAQCLLRESQYLPETYLEALEGISLDDVLDYAEKVMFQSGTSFDVLVFGNFLKETTLSLFEKIEREMASLAEGRGPAKPATGFQHHALKLPKPFEGVYQTSVFSAENVNSGILYHVQCGLSDDVSLQACVRLLGSMSRVPVFLTLRTKEQLGYIVSSSRSASKGVEGWNIIVQSERTPDFLEERINSFLTAYAETLEEMSEETFATHKSSLIESLLVKPKNLLQEGARYWTEIECIELDFFLRERAAAAVDGVTKSEFIDFYKSHILPGASRSKLSVWLVSQRFQASALVELKEALEDKLQDPDSVRAFITSKPNLGQIKTLLSEEGLSNDMGLQHIIKSLSEPLKTPQGVVNIDSIDKFSQSLEKQPRPQPVDDYSTDLLTHL